TARWRHLRRYEDAAGSGTSSNAHVAGVRRECRAPRPVGTRALHRAICGLAVYREGRELAEYLLSQRDLPEIERARLTLLEEKHDPGTVEQLDAIGVGEGWRCVDVGAGAGSATRLLAQRVGSTGSVLAVDIDISLLEELASDRVEVRRLDLL